MPSKNEEKIQGIVNAMNTVKIISGNIVGDQIANTITEKVVPKDKLTMGTTSTNWMISIAAKSYFYKDKVYSFKLVKEQTVTPSTKNIVLGETGMMNALSGAITVQGDANLVSANIVSGKSIFGVNGSASTSTVKAIRIVYSKTMAQSMQYIDGNTNTVIDVKSKGELDTVINVKLPTVIAIKLNEFAVIPTGKPGITYSVIYGDSNTGTIYYAVGIGENFTDDTLTFPIS